MNQFLELKKLLENSYSPYSKYPVSALLELNDGTLVPGVNVENASYGATICAERSCIVQAISRGYQKEDFKGLHVLCGNSATFSTPCFLCRQVIVEFFDENAPIFIYNNKGECRKYQVKDLCPFPFNQEDLC